MSVFIQQAECGFSENHHNLQSKLSSTIFEEDKIHLSTFRLKGEIHTLYNDN